MDKAGGTIVMIGIGVAAIYLGASGHLDSFWRGLTGNCGAASNDAATAPAGTGGQADWRRSNTAFQQGGNATRSGHFYEGPNGYLFVSDGGKY